MLFGIKKMFKAMSYHIIYVGLIINRNYGFFFSIKRKGLSPPTKFIKSRGKLGLDTLQDEKKKWELKNNTTTKDKDCELN